ncbi:MAG: hypothetical protein K2G93_04035 [Rikenella sp.]|nr:hypothetical protein [Rikenella sp.]
MNNYYLNDTPLAGFGFVAGHASGSNLALSGAWDMPARTGESYRQWAGDEGLEPYVRPDDRYVFGTREIQLVGSLLADDEESLRWRIDAFRTFLAGLPAAVELRCDWGAWRVGLRKEVKIRPRRRIASVSLTFTEPLPVLPDFSGSTAEWPRQWILATGRWNRLGVWENDAPWFGRPTVGSIDEWLWESFGLTFFSAEGVWDLPAARELKATLCPSDEAWVKAGIDKHTLTLSATLRVADMEELTRRARNLYWLFGQPGLRRLRYRDRLYDLFAVEGFRISDIRKQKERVYARFTVKLIEAHES